MEEKILFFDFDDNNSNSTEAKESISKGNFIYSFEKSAAYTLAMEILEDVYSVSSAFDKDERFGLINQIRRASVSVVSNIAEGYGRNFGKGRSQFFTYSYASAFEVYCQLEVAFKLGYFKDNVTPYENIRRKIRKLTYLILSMKSINLKDRN